METLNELVKSKKVRYLGCSALLPFQLLKANMIARKNGWAEFISIQNHYNLIYREEEREMIQLLEEEKIVMTPYSPLAAGRVCRLYTDEKTTRSSNDPVNERKYGHAKDADIPVIERVKELSEKKKVTMAQIALAWVLSKPLVASPVIGCTKISQLEELCEAFKVKLSPEEIKFLEELYTPHKIVGAITKNNK